MTRSIIPPLRLPGALVLLGAAALLSTWLGFFLIRFAPAFAVGTALLAAAIAVVVSRSDRLRRRRLLAGWAVLTLVAQLAFLLTGLHQAQTVALGASTVLAVATWVAAWSTRRPARGPAGRVLRGGGSLVAATATALSVLLVSIAADPRPAATLLQSTGGSVNSFEPRSATETVELHGARVTNDIEYGSTYPNSFLDVYLADGDPSVSRPTYVVVHGGGWIAGSKNMGDPNAQAAGITSFALGAGPMLENGYNVVAVDYALAPQVPYPTPVIQLGEAVDFLEANGAAYGLDMSRVVLAGSSAGGQIIGQYAAIQTNEDYSRETGIAPTLDREHLRALVFDSAGLVPADVGRTQAPELLNDWLFSLSARTYFGTSAERLTEGDVTAHAEADFPPSFLADGNTGTFPDQVEDFSRILTGLGVENATDLPPVEDAVLGHGYMAAPSPSTDRYNEHKLAFLASVLG